MFLRGGLIDNVLVCRKAMNCTHFIAQLVCLHFVVRRVTFDLSIRQTIDNRALRGLTVLYRLRVIAVYLMERF